MRGRVGTATATGPAPSQVVPITAATTASPAAMGSGSKNINGGDSRNGNGGDSGKGEPEGGPVHMNQEVRAGKCKLGAGETDSKHSQTGRTTRGEAGVHETGASEEEVWCT